MVFYTVKNEIILSVCVCVCVCSGCTLLYRCFSVRSVEYCTGLFVWRLEVSDQLVVGGGCAAEVRGGGLRCWGLRVFVIKSLRRFWVFSVVVLICNLHLEPTLWCMTSQMYVYLVVNNTKPAAC